MTPNNVRYRVDNGTCSRCGKTEITEQIHFCNDLIDHDAGCTCQICGKKYITDLIVPDELWERIKPAGKPTSAGLICGSCIFTRIDKLGRFGAYKLASV